MKKMNKSQIIFITIAWIIFALGFFIEHNKVSFLPFAGSTILQVLVLINITLNSKVNKKLLILCLVMITLLIVIGFLSINNIISMYVFMGMLILILITSLGLVAYKFIKEIILFYKND